VVEEKERVERANGRRVVRYNNAAELKEGMEDEKEEEAKSRDVEGRGEEE
jgi:hypothetical protein